MLSEKLEQWKKLKLEIELLETEIKEAVLSSKKTEVIDGAKALFSAGRKTYDYETAGQAANESIRLKHTATIIKTDWKKVCEDSGIKDIPFSQGTPSVNLKLT